MKDRPPAFQFYPRQFSGDDQVQMMDLDTVGAHILLICAAGSSPEGYRIATDDDGIRNIVRHPDDKNWKRIKRQLLRGAWKVSGDGLWWESSGLRKVIEKRRLFSEEQKKRVDKRYRKSTEHLPESYGPVSIKDLPDGYSSSSSSSSSSKKITSNPLDFNSTEAAKGYCLKFMVSGPKNYDAVREAIDACLVRFPEQTAQGVAEMMIETRLNYLNTPGKEFTWPAVSFITSGTWQEPDSWKKERQTDREIAVGRA